MFYEKFHFSCLYLYICILFFFCLFFFSPLVTKRKVGGMDNPSEAGTGWGKERKREKTRKKKQTNKKKIAGFAFPTWLQTVARDREKQTERNRQRNRETKREKKK